MLLNPVIDKRQRDLLKINGFMMIGDAAKFLGVATSTLRYWDVTKKIPSSRNPINGYRLYRLEDLENLLLEINNPGVEKI
jgi:hypothetical protein